MIINKDTNPEKDIYYLGAKVIDVISHHKNKELNFFDIFEEIVKTEKISVHLFSLTLDWLFLIGVIDKKSNKLYKCF